MKIMMKRTLGDYKAGKTYEIADWQGRRFVNAGAANPVLDDKRKAADAVVAEEKAKSKKKAKQGADAMTLHDLQATEPIEPPKEL